MRLSQGLPILAAFLAASVMAAPRNVPRADPAGSTTANVPRPRLGSIGYGAGFDIYDCTVPGTVALTFDDGPYHYTAEVLNILKDAGAHATFFVTGDNLDKGAIDNPAYPWVDIIKRMDAEGHQIASHTWDHYDLSTLNEDQRRQQMYKLEMGLRNILGKFPTYMRPPYSSCNAACVATMDALGYHITYFDLDTDDYNNDSPSLIVNAQNNFRNAIDGTNAAQQEFLAIAHDIHQQTANPLTKYMLDTLKTAGYRAVTLGECLGDPVANWYRNAP